MKTTQLTITTICILVFATSGRAAELYVPDEYDTIQAAIDAAYDGDTVIVADGTHTGEGNRDIDFLGKAITVRSESGPENCIIDCNADGYDDHWAFYFHSNEDANSVVSGFTITNAYFSRGAIYCEETSPTISNCALIGNTAAGVWGGRGGAVACYRSNARIRDCTMARNRAFGVGSGGGAIYCQDSSPLISNCTIRENTAREGSGIYCQWGGSPTISNCTIADNESWDGGGGLYVRNATMRVTNCIVWDNSPTQINGSASVTYSNVQGGWDGVGNLDADPNFAFADNYHLMPGSPCIDAGDPNYIPEPNETDIEGKVRVSGDGIDMGAYEYDGSSPLIAISPSSVKFSYAGGAPRPESEWLLVRNCGSGTLEWEIFGDCEWLEVWPASGVSDGQINEVALTVDPNLLASGHYVCALSVLGRNAHNSPVAVQVCLYVGVTVRVPEQFKTIQMAIDEVADGDTILVADGTYANYIDFKGKAITVKSENGPENCIIDCQDSQAGFYFYHGEGRNSVVDGLTVTRGSGGILCLNSSPTITNCVITHNSGWGGIHCDQSSPTISNCIITGNSGTEWRMAGGITCVGSRPVIASCSIYDNSGEDVGGGIGCWDASKPVISQCTIQENYAHSGGGIWYASDAPDSSLTITNCTIRGNTAEFEGGGIACYGNLTFINCSISENSARLGGGIYCELGNPAFSNCVINANTARGKDWAGSGGGISCEQSSLMLTNCIISGNTATNNGGAVHCEVYSVATVINCTFAENWSANGRFLSCGPWEHAYPNTVELHNCIIADGGNEIWSNDDSNVAIIYSNVQGGWEGQGNIDADPCFVEAGYWDVNGVWVEGDYRLLGDSPCIDTGDPNYLPEPNETDLDGNPRVIDGDDNGVAIVDMGAYEHSYGGLYLGVSPRELVFYLREDCKPETQVISIVNIGSGTLSWKITEDCPWVEVHPTRGKSRGEVEKVNVTVDTSGLDFGVYTCELVVSAGSTVRSPQTVKITLHYFEYVEGAIYVPVEYPTIQGAIDAAEDGQMVIVFVGNYKGDGNRDIDFLDKAITVRSESGPENCIIDCNGSESDPHRGFYFHSDEDTNSVLEGFTITNGHASSAGAIYFKGNSNPKIDNCIISQNTARWHGGAIYSIGSSPTITNSTINSNAAEYGYGGGIYSYMGSPVVANCSIQSNSAGSSGGGIYCYKNNATVISCTISGNNVPYYSGGLPAGGGIFCLQSTPAIINCTMVGNGAEFGGGIYVRSGTVVVTNCILWDNLSGQIAGSALAAYSDIQGGWDGVGNIDADPGFIQSGTGYLDDNNTPYSWDDFWVWVDGDFRLLADSPCIDAGDPNYMPEPNERDLDGNPRVIDGDEDGTAVVDMGAYEYRPAVEAEVEIRPEVLNLGSEGRWISCRIRLGEGYDIGDIEAESILLEYEVEAESVKINEEQQVATAKFKRAEVQEIVEAGQVELTVSGELMDGTRFEGTDAIRVINRTGKEVRVGKRLVFGRESGVREEKSGKSVKKD